MFRNEEFIVPWGLTKHLLRFPNSLTFHIPEYALINVVNRIGMKSLNQLAENSEFRINILNQNVDVMPDSTFLTYLSDSFSGSLTCTAAHPSYATNAYRKQIRVPLHLLPAWIYPEEPRVSTFCQKKDVMIVSPDNCEWREAVLSRLSNSLPGIELVTVKKMPFDEYLRLAEIAKWSITFGEGLDDYFAATIHRGGVGFAVFNDRFFTSDYRELRTVYDSWSELFESIVRDIAHIDNKNCFETESERLRNKLRTTWSREATKNALQRYRSGKIDFP
jgi:hypothetical protein